MEVKLGVKMDITPPTIFTFLPFYSFTFLLFYLSKLLSSTKCLTSFYNFLFYFLYYFPFYFLYYFLFYFLYYLLFYFFLLLPILLPFFITAAKLLLFIGKAKYILQLRGKIVTSQRIHHFTHTCYEHTHYQWSQPQSVGTTRTGHLWE